MKPQNNIGSQILFPVGYHNFNSNRLFNFQLNRWYSFGYFHFNDVSEIGRRIKNFADWKSEMMKLAGQKSEEGNHLSAAFYYRAAEFYMLDDTDEKNILYDNFRGEFDKAMHNEAIERVDVPYLDAYLPVIRFKPDRFPKGIIVLHGGFDSFIEEFYSMMKYFTNSGYEIIAFEGPGQGAARRKYGLAFDTAWEKPVRTVLDHCGLNDVTLLGISMGGWLAIRAAAFEKRITRVIASGHAIDYMRSMPRIFYRLHMWLYNKHKPFMSRLTEKKFLRGKESIPAWMVKHLMYITKKKTAMEALETYLIMNTENIHSELIDQDVLLLQGKGDHFIPFKMLEMQKSALTNAKSVTARAFTREDHAQNHCQVGNIGLSLEVMLDWIGQIS